MRYIPNVGLNERLQQAAPELAVALRLVWGRKSYHVDCHVAALWGLVVATLPKSIVEIGVRKGDSTTILAHAAKTVGAKMLSVDIVPCPGAVRRIADLGLVDTITFSCTGSRAAAETVADESVDLIYIDGDHKEAGVQADIEAWTPKLKDGATVIAHDFERPGVKKPFRATGWPIIFLRGEPSLAILQKR